MTLWTATIVFFASLAVNFLNARYIKYIAKSKIVKAAIYSELVVVAYSFNVISLVDNYWYIIPMIIGGFIGTLLSNVDK